MKKLLLIVLAGVALPFYFLILPSSAIAQYSELPFYKRALADLDSFYYSFDILHKKNYSPITVGDVVYNEVMTSYVNALKNLKFEINAAFAVGEINLQQKENLLSKLSIRAKMFQKLIKSTAVANAFNEFQPGFNTAAAATNAAVRNIKVPWYKKLFIKLGMQGPSAIMFACPLDFPENSYYLRGTVLPLEPAAAVTGT